MGTDYYVLIYCPGPGGAFSSREGPFSRDAAERLCRDIERTRGLSASLICPGHPTNNDHAFSVDWCNHDSIRNAPGYCAIHCHADDVVECMSARDGGRSTYDYDETCSDCGATLVVHFA